ncbi:hypothetical protein CVT26_003941 [Gymnopilus dilepis]|uniref:Uncharacterized protein n=1 Tax=Gymnopilus dilepis TaxID=231916 RepID=A0A409WKD6_9AGAR|nr:hypothetical protein CVT26_003941 [Gymnopilus dilepis]
MPARESFVGLRKAFLEKEQDGYRAAVANGTKDDFLMDVVRRFLKRFPVDLPDDMEPTAEHLAQVDDALPDPERVAPDPQDMAEDQQGYARALENYEKTTKLIDFRTKQIARWFNYRFTKYNKGVNAKTKQTDKQDKAIDLNDPMTIFTLRLLGKPVMRPRKSVDYHLWAKDNKAAVEKAYAAAGIKGAKDLKVYSRISKKLFAKESDTVKEAYKKQAEDEHEEAMKKWEEVFQRPASTAPESRQACINGIAGAIQPVCDLIHEATGMQVLLLVGGPEPAAGGRLNILGLHAGGTKGPIKNTFPESDPEKYHNQFLSVYSAYLRKCYTREDCQASALSSNILSKLTCLDGKQLTYVQGGDEDGSSLQSSAPVVSAPPTTPSASSPMNTSASTLVNTASATPSSSDSSSAANKEPRQTKKHDSKKAKEHTDTLEVGRKGSREESRGKRKRSDQQAARPPLPSALLDTTRGVRASPLETSDLSGGKEPRDNDHAASPPSPFDTSESAKGVEDSLVEGLDLSRGKRTKVNHQASALPPTVTSNSPKSDLNSPAEGPGVPSPTSIHSPHASPAFATPHSVSSSSHFSSLFRPSPPLFSSPPRSLPSLFPSPIRLNSSVQNSVSDEDHGANSDITSPGSSLSNTSVPPSSPSPCGSGEATAGPRFNVIKGVDNGLAARLAARFQAPLSPPIFPPPKSKTRREANLRCAKERSPKKTARRSKVAEDSDKENAGCGSKRKTAPSGEKSLAKRHKGPQLASVTASGHAAGHESSPSPSATSTTSPQPIYYHKNVVFDPSHLSGPHLMAQLPEDCHPGLKNTLKMATSVSWIRVWQLMTAEWVRFEKLNNFEESSKKLKPTNRPAAVGDWIKRARSSTYRPNIDVNKFQSDFWAWYCNIQPKWRSISDGNTPMEVRGKWDEVDVPGVNGWPSVVAALFFWGVALGQARNQSDSWYSAVNDAYWVLNQLCGSRLY